MPNDLHVSIATPSDRAEWEEYVTSRGDAAGYHSWGWQRVFKDAFGHRCVYLMARSGNRLTGVLPLVEIRSRLFGNTLTSLPFLNYGGVIADSSEAADALAEAAKHEAKERRCGHVELRHVSPRFPQLPAKRHKVSMRLPLAGDLWAGFDRKLRNQIRKGEKSGLTVERGGAGLIPEFYDVFARNMRDLGTPVYSRRLFEEVFRAFPDRSLLHVVRLGKKAVAAGITYRTAQMVQLPWASSIREFNSLCANMLLYWDAVQFASETGASCFDMGRSTPGEGTFKYKAQWGARPVPLHWEYQLVTLSDMPNLSPANPKFQFVIGLWQKLPLALTRRVGPMIVRTIP